MKDANGQEVTTKDIERYYRRNITTHLLLFVNKTVLNNLNKCSQMGEDSTAHEDCDLLDNLDPSVTGL